MPLCKHSLFLSRLSFDGAKENVVEKEIVKITCHHILLLLAELSLSLLLEVLVLVLLLLSLS